MEKLIEYVKEYRDQLKYEYMKGLSPTLKDAFLYKIAMINIEIKKYNKENGIGCELCGKEEELNEEKHCNDCVLSINNNDD